MAWTGTECTCLLQQHLLDIVAVACSLVLCCITACKLSLLKLQCYCDTGWVPGKTDAKALWGLLTGSWLNLLLLVVPVGWIVHFCHLNSVLVFVLVSPYAKLSFALY